jgi:3-phosphoshikimate 1-carboxyvinyltransferase
MNPLKTLVMPQYKSSLSPWSSNKDVESVRVDAHHAPINGEIAIPGSKSFTNRALIIAAAASGKSNIGSILKSEDSYWCIEALKNLGLDINVDGETVSIDGQGGLWSPAGEPLFIGSAGTTGRFLSGLLAMTADENIQIEATEQLSGRPMQGIFEGLTSLGASIEYLDKQWHFPVAFNKPGETGGEINMSGSLSSQFISGTLIAAPYAQKPVTINITDKIVQEDYVRITLDVMKEFGVDVDVSGFERFYIEPQKYQARDYAVEADASTASYFMALAAVSGGSIKLTNLNAKTLQPDILVLDVFEKMGCQVSRDASGITVKGPEKLKGGFTVDMKQFSDTALTVAAVAPFADDYIEIRNVEHIRAHESDRVSVMCESLQRLGIKVEEFADGMKIYPGEPKFGIMKTHDDHRVAMSLAVLGIAGNGVELLEPSCVSKTCPLFFEYLRKLGCR